MGSTFATAMMNIIISLIDIVFPPRQSQQLIRAVEERMSSHLHISQTSEGVFTLTSYQDSVIQALIVENKYYQNRRAAKYLATFLDSFIESLAADKVLLVPIPLSTARQRQRGYNQVVEIIRQCSSAERSIMLLKRAKDTPPQTSLNKSARLRNLSDSFAVNESKLQKIPIGSTVLLVDDVVTTGTTLREAAAVLNDVLPTNCQLYCVALAH